MSEDLTKTDLETSKLIAYGQLFAQLLESERFRSMLETFFTFQKFVDDHEKIVTFQVIENPPEVVAQKMSEQAAKLKPEIELVSGQMAQKILDKAKEGAKR